MKINNISSPAGELILFIKISHLINLNHQPES